MRQVAFSKQNIFLQTRPTTCGIACMMMILASFKGDELSPSIEGKYLYRLKIKGYSIVPAISLATHLKKMGLLVNVHHQNAQKFWQKIRSEMPEFAEEQARRYKHARTQGVIVDRNKRVDMELIQDYLEKNYLIILGIDLPGEIKHAVLVYKTTGDVLYYVDPMIGEKDVQKDALFGMVETSSGSWCIAVKI